MQQLRLEIYDTPFSGRLKTKKTSDFKKKTLSKKIVVLFVFLTRDVFEDSN